MSEAYFARLLGLPFVAVMPASTSPSKIALIEFQGGRCHLVDDPSAIYAESHRLADASGGLFMDQFTNSERATDWRGNNNIVESIFEQLARERHPMPTGSVALTETGLLGMLRPHAAGSAYCPIGSCSLGVRWLSVPA